MAAEDCAVQCKTVADFLDLFQAAYLVRTGLKADATEAVRRGAMAQEHECSRHVAAAIAFYGPVVYHGRFWTRVIPPRTGEVYSIRYLKAVDLPWTVESTKTGLPPAPPTRLAGRIIDSVG